MKTVIYEDRHGKLHRTILRDSDPDDLADEGISLDPPKIDDILDEAKIELHNELVKRGLFDVKSINMHSGALASAVNKCVTNKIVRRYLEEESISAINKE